MGIRLAAAIGVAVSLCLMGGTALGQGVDEATRLYLAANFDEAARTFEAALEAPDLTSEDAATAHLYLAALRAMVDRDEDARAHAEAALALDPELGPPEGAPPRFAELLDRVRRDLGGRAELELRIAETDEDGLVARARLSPAPEALVAELALACDRRGAGGGRSVERAPPPEVVLSLDASEGAIACEAAALTRAGAALLRATAGRDPGPEAPPAPPTEPEPTPGAPRVDSLWLGLGIGLGVVVVVAAVVAGVVVATSSATIGDTVVEGW